VFGFFVSFLIWIIIQDKPERTCEKILHTPHHTDKPFSVSFALKDIFLCPQTWLTAIYAGLMVTPVIAFAELWAIPFLMQSYHIHSIIAADLNTAIFIGIGVGGPVNGWLVSKLKQPKKIMAGGNIVALLSLITIIYIPNLSYVFGAVLLFIFGFSTSSMLIAFSLNKNRHSNQHSGLVTAFTNMIIMIMGAIYQPVIGKLLDLFLELKTPSVYTLVDFHHALIILPITSAISLLVILMIKIKPQEQINKNLRPLARV
jgi:MFS family permease